jgi:hypothetical protein
LFDNVNKAFAIVQLITAMNKAHIQPRQAQIDHPASRGE